MANILYSASGDGFGHASRTKEVATYLKKQGHSLTLMSYDMGYDFLSRHFEVEKIKGLRLTYKDNQVKYFPTLLNNFLSSKATLKQMDKINGIIASREIDLVISDFEPMAAASANLKKIPVISLDNMHIITRADIDVPKNNVRDYLNSMMVVRLMIFKAKKYLITSFFEAETIDDKTVIVPPIVRREIMDLKPKKGDYFLVYLTSGYEEVAEVLAKTPYKFVIYGLKNKKKTANLTYKKTDQAGFLKDLQDCRGVIATAGFSLISEALYLKKPYCAIPVRSQFEQMLNAHYLQKLGYGKLCREFNEQEFEAYIDNYGSYEKALANYAALDNSKLFAELDSIIYKYSKK